LEIVEYQILPGDVNGMNRCRSDHNASMGNGPEFLPWAIGFQSLSPIRSTSPSDLGGGLIPDHGTKTLSPEEVTSTPFLAVLKGMTHDNVQWLGSVGMSFKGFASLMAESLLQDPMADGRFGGPSYAVVAADYLNFNTRLGYHFATVDSFCGENHTAIYITFFFKGGAADIVRRARRASLISTILKRMDFHVETRGDMVQAELKKVEAERIQDRLDQLGRLMGAVRLLDMVLSDEGHVMWYEEEFFLRHGPS
jgi:pyruvate, water dikinase